MCHPQRSGFVLPAAGRHSQDGHKIWALPQLGVLGLARNCRSESWAEEVRPTLAGFMGAIPDRVTYNTLPGTASLAAFYYYTFVTFVNQIMVFGMLLRPKLQADERCSSRG